MTENHFRLPKYFSIFSAELYAILKALEHVNKNKIPKCLILSDSLGALQTLNHVYPKNPLEKMVKSELEEAQENSRRITFIWIPSHIGIDGNEAADQCARKVSESVETEVTECRNLASDIKSYFRNLITCKWNQEWKYSQTSLRTIKDNVYPRLSRIRARKLQTVITRLRIGHTRYTHSHLFTRDDPPKCEICDEINNVKHFLIDCPLFANERIRFNIPNNINKLLGTDGYYDNIANYLKCIGLYYRI